VVINDRAISDCLVVAADHHRVLVVPLAIAHCRLDRERPLRVRVMCHETVVAVRLLLLLPINKQTVYI
jgi:hypothetical protein